jgi:hypothetical protein
MPVNQSLGIISFTLHWIIRITTNLSYKHSFLNVDKLSTVIVHLKTVLICLLTTYKIDEILSFFVGNFLELRPPKTAERSVVI